MVWGWPKPNASNGGWTGYGNGKGRSGKAAGKWGEERPWQNRGGSKGAKVTKDTVPAFLKAWTAAQDKKMVALQKQFGQPSAGPAKQQDDQIPELKCQCGYDNRGHRQQCNSCKKRRKQIVGTAANT